MAFAVMAMMRGRDSVGPALADAARGVEAVHLGHLDVHQHDVVGLPLERLERLEAVRRDVGAVAQLVEHPERDLLVHGVVLGQEDPQRRRLGHARRPCRPSAAAGLPRASRATRSSAL